LLAAFRVQAACVESGPTWEAPQPRRRAVGATETYRPSPPTRPQAPRQPHPAQQATARSEPHSRAANARRDTDGTSRQGYSHNAFISQVFPRQRGLIYHPYKGKSIDAKAIGKELSVRYVLEGSVQRDQNRVRVNAQLIDAETGAHLWADRFEEDVADLFKLQDQVVARLANAVGQQLVIAEAEKGARSKDPDAIDLTMRGQALMQSMSRQATKEQNDAAIAMFEQAVKIDPKESDALAGLALAYARSKLRRWNPETDYTAKILDLSERAIELDPNNVTAYLAKAFYSAFAHDWNEVIRTATAGLAIDPNSPALYAARGTAEGLVGRYDERIADLETSRKLSPRARDFFPFWWCQTCSVTEKIVPDCVRVNNAWTCL
jgi:tetratricopeptide (TPR) repeat protein